LSLQMKQTSPAKEMAEMFSKILDIPVLGNNKARGFVPTVGSDVGSVEGNGESQVGQGNIVIVGVGGCGSNTVETLAKLKVKGIKLVAINTDKHHLDGVEVPNKILIGESITNGLGAGGIPEVARACAEHDAHKISEALGNRPDLVFIAAGMGGGTGTGAAPVVAKIAKDKGAKVIGFVTMPFRTEGRHKMRIAQEGVKQLRKWADTVVLISNDKLLQLAGDLSVDEAFKMADLTLATMVKGIAEIIWRRTMMNIDLNDIKLLMSAGGVAAVGIGQSSDPKRRASEAVKMALRNQLIDISPDGARGALIVVYGGNLKLNEVYEISEIVTSRMSSDAIVKIGADTDPSLGDTLRVILLLTGVKSPDILGGNSIAPKRPTLASSSLSGDGGFRFGKEVDIDSISDILGGELGFI